MSKAAKSTSKESASQSDSIKVLRSVIDRDSLSIANEAGVFVKSARICLHQVDLLIAKQCCARKSQLIEANDHDFMMIVGPEIIQLKEIMWDHKLSEIRM